MENKIEDTGSKINVFDKDIINLVKNQTNYTEEEIKKKLKLYDNNYMLIIKEYLNIKPKQTSVNKSTNQIIMGEIRYFLDNKKKRIID
jgi:hypothetical protein